MTALVNKHKIGKFKELMLDFPLYIISRPFKGFDEMKFQGRGSMIYAVLILLVFGLVRIWEIMGTGFIYIEFFWEVPSVHVPWVLAFAYAPIALVCVANWSITSITDGKGKLKEIFLVYCYALFPAIVCTMIAIVLSNYVTIDETAFVTFFFVFGQILLYFYLFLGLLVIHEFSFTKGIVMVLLTMLAMLIIIFVLALFVMLVSEVVGFIITLIQETETNLL
ncbi:MAG: YIP1 family protein [Defluviitaleaceae bacterium]|nr:YIP1 family protein [Defluviitaleaceae bacterium]